MTDLKVKIKEYWQLIILIIIGLVFVFIYSYLAYSLPTSYQQPDKLVLNSPDETSNLFFARLFAEEGELRFKDSANILADDLVSPRSMRVINSYTVPASFLGMPIIYGLIAKLTDLKVIPFITPIIGATGLIFFYFLIVEIFNKKTALISSLLAFIVPGFWYYAGKSLMPNVAFLSFFIIAFYFLIRALKNKKIWSYIFLGFFLALSLMIRTSEVVWIFPLFIAIALVNLKEIRWPKALLSVIIFLIVFSPIFFFNQQIYGTPLSVGYSLKIDFNQGDVLGQSLSLAEQIFLPFGFNPALALKNLYNYTFRLFPFWTVLILASFLIFILRLIFDRKDFKVRLFYLVLFLFISGYLAVYYGSWQFHDHPDPNAVTIGTSYIRYWLPIYIFSLPAVGWTLTWFFKGRPVVMFILTAYLFLSLGFGSYELVMLDREEGLVRVKENLKTYQQIAKGVFDRTQENSIIVAESMDKVFFPDRRVIYKLNNQLDYDRIKKLIAGGYPVYYFHFTKSQPDLDYLNNNVFLGYGLAISQSLIDFGNQSLYRFEPAL